MTIGSCDSSRIARPGYHGAPRVGLLLVITAASACLVQACVDQPLTVVETPPAAGGTASVAAEGGGAKSRTGEGGSDERTSGKGGSAEGTGGRTTSTKDSATGGSNSVSLECPNDVGDLCDPGWGCCWGSGLICDSYRCRKENGASCDSEDDCKASSSCKNGICTSDDYYPTTCIRIGKRCTNSSQCCSGKCEQVENEKRCLEIEGCKPVREYSLYPWVCCSSKLVTTVSSGAYCDYDRSDTEPETCKLSGETCGDSAWDRKPCCDGLECLAGPESVTRCTSKPSQSARCNTSMDCAKIGPAEAPSAPRCIKYSSPEDAKNGSRGASYGTCEVCVEEGGGCHVNYDCCESDGLECNNDVCTKRAL